MSHYAIRITILGVNIRNSVSTPMHTLSLTSITLNRVIYGIHVRNRLYLCICTYWYTLQLNYV